MDKMDSQKEKMLKCLAEFLGNVTNACEKSNTARSTHYLWCSEDEAYKARVEEINEMCIDHVENKLHEKINGVTISKGEDEEGRPRIYEVPPSDTAIIFFLKTRAKKRGYVEKTQTEVSGELSIKEVTGMEVK